MKGCARKANVSMQQRKNYAEGKMPTYLVRFHPRFLQATSTKFHTVGTDQTISKSLLRNVIYKKLIGQIFLPILFLVVAGIFQRFQKFDFESYLLFVNDITSVLFFGLAFIHIELAFILVGLVFILIELALVPIGLAFIHIELAFILVGLVFILIELALVPIGLAFILI